MTVDEQIARIDTQLDEFKKQREQAQRRRMVACHKCSKRTRIDRLLFVQNIEYEEPYSCSAGDYYYDGEGAFICPHCGHCNRLPKKSSGSKWHHPKCEQLNKLRRYFAAVAENYKSGKTKLAGKWYVSLDEAWQAFQKDESA